LGKMFGQYQSKGLIFYRISAKESPDTIRQYMTKESLNMPVLVDKTGQTERLFGVWVHPTTYLINRQGSLVDRIMGAMDWTGMSATGTLDQLLKGR
jgi:peroxiredoxin